MDNKVMAGRQRELVALSAVDDRDGLMYIGRCTWRPMADVYEVPFYYLICILDSQKIKFLISKNPFF